jgi:transcriptional regulator with GAF, ATPase, and Fis domain
MVTTLRAVRSKPVLPFSPIVLDEKMRQLHDLIDVIRSSSVPILLLGETGCGKEVIAEQIHGRSARAGAAFLRLDCAGLSESVVESELFGHGAARSPAPSSRIAGSSRWRTVEP